MKKFSRIFDGLRSITPYSPGNSKYGFKFGARHSGRTRGLQLEKLEDRTLLSINGIGAEQDLTLLDNSIETSPIYMSLASASDIISLHYDLPNVLIETVEETSEGSIISEAIMPGTQQFGREGETILPLLPVEIVIPYGSEINTIEVLADDSVTLLDTYNLHESPTALIIDPNDDANDDGGQNVMDAEPLEYDVASELYEIVGTQWSRGVETILINLKPVQYVAETGTVSYCTSMTLNVSLVESNPLDLADNPIQYRPDDMRSLEQDVANPEALSTYIQSTSYSSLPSLGICDPADSYQYVVITNQSMLDATTDYTINDLVAYKQAHGMSATAITVEDIYANYSGVDQQEKIRNFVTDAYNHWETDFVLLGGDTNVIPYRSLYVPISSLNSTERSVPSDLYYQCLDGNFNYDGDSYWGESNDGVGGGEVDFSAEVYIGRVSAENTTEMANWVYKNIAYENSASDPYRLDAVMLGEHLGFGGVSDYATASMEEIRLGTSNHGYTTAGFAADPSFTTSTLYDSPSSSWSSSTLINQFNSNAHGIYNHLGHANTSSVMKLSNSTVDSSLTNDNFFFLYSQGCYPGEFPSNAIAEHFTTSTRTGAAAVVFNSRYGWGRGNSTDGPSQHPDREFWDALFGEGLDQLGTMNADSHEDCLWSMSDLYIRYVTYETNLFGDPAAKIASFDLSVVGSSPTAGSTVTSPISDFTITFSEPYSTSSIDAGDLLVNGVGADSFTLDDSYNITFHYTTSPVTTQGLQNMEIAAGSILRDSDDNPVLAWGSSFRYDAQVVSVVATDPPNHSATIIPFDTLRIDFDEPIDPASIGTNDLTLSEGSVVAASMVDADTVEYTLTGVTTEGTMTFNLHAGAVSDTWGNPGAAYSGNFTLDIAMAAFPTPLTALTPPGGLIYSGTTSGTIAPSADTDSFTIDLDVGQTLTALVQPSGGLQPAITITDPGGTVLGSVDSSGANRNALLQTVPVATAGTYTVTIGSVGGTTSGDFALELTLNAVLEEEVYLGGDNDTLATAQDITGSFVKLGDSTAQRGAVAGSLSPSPTADIIIDSENFDSGSLGPQWSTYHSNSYGRIQITGTYGTAGGSRAMVMDSRTDDNYALNEAIWTVDLSGTISPSLSFYSRGWNEEITSFSGDFTGHKNADGVAISADGVTWHPVWTAVNASSWKKVTIDLAAEATAHGISLNSNFKIKFQQYDNFALTTDGIGYDEIKITSSAIPGEDWYQFTLDGDESSTLALATKSTGMALELYDSSGNLLSSGVPAQNFAGVISNFVSSSSDTYYARVAGYGNDYQLVVMKNADFDMGDNGTFGNAQLLLPSPGNGASAVLGYLGSQRGGIVIEPDDYPAGTTMTNIVPGVTLTVQGESSSVTSQTSSDSSTGTRVFAHGTNAYWASSGEWLRADFSTPATSVSIDLIPDDSDDPGIMRAYNAAGTLIQEVTCPAPPQNSFATLTISRSTADIAYILAAGRSGDTAALDNLVVAGIATNEDYYKVPANIGDPLIIETGTPADGPNEFVNDLDPKIELYAPDGTLVASDDNSATDGRNAKLTHVATMDGEYTVRITSNSDTAGEYVLLLNASQVTLTMPSDAWEDGGPVTATVDIPAPLPEDLIVNLTSDNPGRIGVPASVTIPAGQTSLPITLDVIDDALLQGPRDVTITATTASYGSSMATINLHDDETAIMAMLLPADATEGDGLLAGAGRIFVDTAPVNDVTIQLLSSDDSEISVPPSVVLPAGQSSVTFDITVEEDTLIDNTQTATISASVENWTTGQASMDVLDNDRTLAVTLPADVWEGQGLMAGMGTVQIGGTLPHDLVVSLASDDTSELEVPATVTILAGQTSATFDVTILDDSDWDGMQAVTVTAGVSGFMGDETSQTIVHDNEVDRFLFSVISDPQTASIAFAAEILAKNTDDETILVYDETINITGTGDSGSLPIVPGSCEFVDGVWTGNVAVNAVDSNVTLAMDDGIGGTGQSNSFDVVPGALASLQLSTVSSPQYLNAPFALTVTAVDAHGHTVTDFNDTVDISGLVNTGTSSSIVISEIEVGATDRIEFANVSGHDLDIGGWTIWAYDSAYPTTPQALLTIPDGTLCPAGELFILEEFGTAPGAFPHFYSGTNLNWTPMAQTGVLLMDNFGSVMDFVAASDLDPATVSDPVTIVPKYWQGDQVDAVNNETLSYQRVGNIDHNDASDWVIDRTPTIGTLNAGMDTSFTGGVVTIEPTFFTLVDGVCTDTIAVLQTVNDMLLRVDDGNGHVTDSNTFDVLPPSLMLFLPSDVTEGGMTIAAVSLTTPTDTDLTIHLASSDPSRLNVPAEVIIPAGQITVMIPVLVIDNTLLDGPQDITLTVTTTDYLEDDATIHFHDNETAILTVSLPGSATEGDGVLAGVGMVSASAAPTRDIVVQLASSDDSEVAVPATVVLPAGQTEVAFDVTILDDTLIDDTQTAMVTATVENWTSGSTTMDVLDDDRTLAVTLPTDVWEGESYSSGMVEIGGTLPTDLVISLASDDTSELDVPATVTILAGQTTATFVATIPTDSDRDGLQTPNLTATSSGFGDATASTAVHDSNVDHFEWDMIDSPQRDAVPFAVTAQAINIDGELIVVDNNSASLIAAGDSGAVPVTPGSCVFVGGIWTGNVVIDAVDTNVTLTMDDGSGATGASNAFDIVPGPVASFQWSTIATPQYEHAPFTVTLTALDVNGYVVTDFDDTVDLSGWAGDIPYAGTPSALGDTTLAGTDLQLGINADGSLILSNTTLGAKFLGREFITPGTPQASFSLAVDGYTYHNNKPAGASSISMTVQDISGGGYLCAQALGTQNGISINRQIRFRPDEHIVTFQVVLENTSGATKNNIAWLENYDPDQGKSVGGSYSTDNDVLLEYHYVEALYKNSTYPNGLTIGMGSDDPRAVASAEGFDVVSPFEVINSPADPNGTSNDIASNLAFDVGTLAPGESTKLTYYMVFATDRQIAEDLYLSQQQMQVPISPTTATFVNGIWTGNVSVLKECDDVYLQADYGGGITDVSNKFEVLPLTMSFEVLATDPSETDGTVMGEITLPAALGEDLVVDLVSSNPGRVDVPASVIIPAGQASLSVPLTIVDNTLLDGTETITITATAPDYSITDDDTLTVHDDETAVLSVSLPADATEGDGVLAGMGTITSSEAPSRDIVVQLTSSDDTEVTVPATVVLPAGQTSVDFDVTILDDTLIDDTQTATITATVENWTDGVAAMDVLDNDRTMMLTLPTDAWEGEGTLVNVGTVEIGGTLPTDLVVSLSSDDTSELNVPATVTIPAGQTSVLFDVTIVDDTDPDGQQTPMVTAGAAGFSDATASATVHDNELDHFAWDTIASPQTAGEPVAVIVHALNVDNEDIMLYNETVPLSAAGDSGSLPLTPSDGTFSNGLWSGDVVVDAVDTNVVLTLDDGMGNTADSNSFDLVPGPVADFQWSTIASPQYVNVPFSTTLTAVDANGYTVTDFNDTVDLSGWTGSAISHTIFNDPAHTNTSSVSSDYTLGYSFTPNVDIQVTHFSHYFGDKVSLWTDSGTLLASEVYTSTAGTWTETPLTTPVQLYANTTYRIGAHFAPYQPYYWRKDMGNTFPDGTILQSYEEPGDAFPDNADSPRWWFVSMRYDVDAMTSVAIAPTSATFSGGTWTGDVTVLETATDMYLQLDNGGGLVDESNTFDVLATPIDYGDAPSPYPTLVADNGASHVIASGFHLGSAIDAEADGQPSADAMLDDTSGTPDDEDGVVFSSPLYLGMDATIDVTASAAGQLDAWIDFNDDGDWDDAGEKVFDNVSLAAGVNTLHVTVPATVMPSDQTFARFRLSSTGGLSYTGTASDGEVEDYAVAIQLAPPTLDAEPALTPGTENTVTWSAVIGANGYYVECDNDADFSSPEANSGWITGTSYTFVGLTAGETYYYRVKSRLEIVGGVEYWHQTTQADFAGDVLDNTNITNQPGDVILEGSPAISDKDILWDLTHGVYRDYQPSGDFSDLANMLTSSGYTLTTTAVGLDTMDLSSYEVIVVNLASAWDTQYTTAEVAVLELFVQNGGGLLVQGDNPSCPNANVNPVAQAFGTTVGVSTTDSDYVTNFESHAICDSIGTIAAIASGAVTTSSPSMVVARSSSGYDIVTVAEVGAGRVVTIGDAGVWADTCIRDYDNTQLAMNVFEWLAEDTGYAPHGSIVSAPISPIKWQSWGGLSFGNTTPTGTTLTVDVLPATGTTPIPGYENLTGAVDLSGITETTIRLRANLATTDPSATPALHEWAVTWQQPDLSFESPWSNIEFSMQSATSLPGDANNDGIVDSSDLALLANDWQQSVTPLSSNCDFNGDGVVDSSDLALLANNWQMTLSTHSTTSDSNSDGVVDSSDLALLANHWQESDVAPSDGDSNGDGVVDSSDLALLANQWQEPSEDASDNGMLLALATAPDQAVAEDQSTDDTSTEGQVTAVCFNMPLLVGPQQNMAAPRILHLAKPSLLQNRVSANNEAAIHDTVFGEEYGQATEQMRLERQVPYWSHFAAAEQKEMGPTLREKFHQQARIRAIDWLLMDPEL